MVCELDDERPCELCQRGPTLGAILPGVEVVEQVVVATCPNDEEALGQVAALEGILAPDPVVAGGRRRSSQLGPQVGEGHRLEVADLLPQAHHLAPNINRGSARMLQCLISSSVLPCIKRLTSK